MPTFNQMKQGYTNLWGNMKITRTAQVDAAARKIIKLKDRYLAIENSIGTPWYLVGALHMRESNNSFAGVLHNGDKIIGTGRKTYRVPKGRGPFASWEESAIDALKIKGHDKIKDWSIERVLYEAERFNGWGYLNKTNSPYIWAGSSLYTRGKYVRDHVYSSTTVDSQLGVAPVIKRILELEWKSDLPAVSTRVKVQNRFRRFWTWTGLGGILSMSTVETVYDFAKDWWAVILLGVFASVWLFNKWLEYKSQAEYDEDRYIPSGEVEEEVDA